VPSREIGARIRVAPVQIDESSYESKISERFKRFSKREEVVVVVVVVGV
jgi:hypothetical protein